MCERAMLAGGTFQIESDTGTRKQAIYTRSDPFGGADRERTDDLLSAIQIRVRAPSCERPESMAWEYS